MRTICPRIENFEILGRMVSAHVYTDTKNFVLHSHRSALTQGYPVHCTEFPAKPVCQVGVPFVGRFIPRVANVSLE